MPKGIKAASAVCSIPGCGKPHKAQGLCSGHYARLLKGHPLDTPLAEPPPDPTLPRACKTCREVKPISEFYVRSDGLPDRHCKRCAGETMKPGAAKRRREAGMKERWKRVITVVDGLDGQECSWCREWKPLTEFYVYVPLKGDPYPESRCKSCTQDQVKAHHRETADPNRQRYLGVGENRELSRIRDIRYREEGRYAESRRKAMEQDPARFRAYSAKRRALVMNAPVSDLTGAQWRVILESQENRCAYCNRTQPLTIDHVVPLSRGGSHTASNIVGACQRCNSQKRAKTLAEWAGPQPA